MIAAEKPYLDGFHIGFLVRTNGIIQSKLQLSFYP